MANGIKLELDLEAQQAIRVLSKLTKGMDKFGKTTEKSAKRSLNSFGALKAVVGGQAIIGGVRALGRAFLSSGRDAIDFSKSIAEVNTLLDDNKQLTEEAKRTFIDFSDQYTGNASAQAKGYYNIVSAGITDTTEAMRVLEIANKAAVAGLTSIDQAAKVVVSSVNAFRDSNLDAQTASDKLFLAVKFGQTTFSELSNGIGRSLAIASKAGVKFGELTGTLAFLTKTGISTDEAVTGIRSLLVSVIKPGEEAAKVARDLGIQFDTAAIRAKGFPLFLKDVIDKTGGSEKELAKLFPNVRALGPILQTAGKNFGEFASIVEASMRDTAGTTEKAFKIIAESAGFQLERLGQQLKNVPQAFLVSFEQPIALAVKAIREFVSENGIGLVGKAVNFAVGAFSFFDRAIVKTQNAFVTMTNFLFASVLSIKQFALEVNQASQAVARFLGFDPTEGAKIEEKLLKAKISGLKQAIEVGKEEQRERSLAFNKRLELVKNFEAGVNESIAKQEARNKAKNENLLKEDTDFLNQKTEAEKLATLNRFNAISELQLAQEDLDNQRLEEQKILAEVRTSEEYEALRAGLGEEQALRALYRAKELKEQGKGVESKKVLSDSLRKSEKGNIFAIQKFEELSNKQRLANIKSTLGTIGTLTQSSNSTLFAIGKAAAVSTATIDGIAATQKALASAPAPFNFVLAALVGVASAVNIAKIASAPKPAFAQGGFIGTGASTGDLVDVRAQRGEAILNPNQQQNFMSLANGGGGGSSELLASIDSKLSQLINKETVLMANGRAIAQTVRDEIRDGFRIA